jgi:NADPH-dependent 2,4-dienoyl-CoA reductase/sulfur reductase-like enzyme
MSEHLVIVGGGQAGAQAVQSLRQQSFAGAITLLCDEPYPPYQRPPLSKKYFAGELARERLLLRPPAFYAEKGVTLELGTRAEQIDPAARRVTLRDGRSLAYDRLLLTTGSRARALPVPGVDLPGVHYLRTIADVDAILASLAPGARVLLIGAGYIGLEVAASARQRGFEVTVLEAANPRHVARRQHGGLGLLRSVSSRSRRRDSLRGLSQGDSRRSARGGRRDE